MASLSLTQTKHNTMNGAPGSQPALYVPHVKYTCSKGLTVNQFENEAGKAVPVDQDNTTFGLDTLAVFNASGKQVYITLDKFPPVSSNFPNERWNNVEIDSLPLGSGRCVFFNLGPCHFRLCLPDVVLSQKCKQYSETDTGLNFTHLENKILTFRPGAISGEWDLTVTEGNNQDYLEIINAGRRNLSIRAVRVRPALFETQAQIRDEIMSREPDTGPQIWKEFIIEPNNTKWLLVPRRTFTVRFLQCPNDEDDDQELLSQVPNKEDYCEISAIEAQIGDMVGLFLTQDGEGCEAATYLQVQCKPVNSDLVTTRKLNGL